MKHHTKVRLSKKGWKQEEITKAESILYRKDHRSIKFSKTVFWISIIVIILGNLIVSFSLILFLIFLNSWILLGVTALIAWIVGMFYNHLIHDVDHLEKKHHLIPSIIIPVIAMINVVFVVILANQFISLPKVNNIQHNPVLIATIYSLSFIAPYLLEKVKRRTQSHQVVITK